MEITEQVTKLYHMADKKGRHDYSIGDYWNAVEHAAEVLEEMAKENEKLGLMVVDLVSRMTFIKGGDIPNTIEGMRAALALKCTKLDGEQAAVLEALKKTFFELYEGAEIQVPPVKAIAMLKDDVLCGRENFRLTHNGYLRLDKIRVDLQAALDFEVKHSAELVDRVVALKDGLRKQSAALSRIDYLCSQPNEMEVSGYDVHCNEDAVVKHVETRLLAMASAALPEALP